MAMKTVLIPPPSAGIVNDPRADGKVARIVTNFDVLTNPKKLTPYHDSEDGDVSAATSKKQNFAVALRTGTTYSLYSLGVMSGTAKAEVLYKDLTDLADNTWDTPANNQSSSGTTSFSLFTYYRKTGLIYGAKSNTTVWAFSPSGAAFDDSQRSLSYTNVAEGLVHSKDDILYIPYDNLIAKNDNGAWTDSALTGIPASYYITKISEQGNNIAITCAPLSGIGGTRVFIWDRDATLNTLQESIDWGEGVCKVMQEIDGVLIGISLYGNNQTRFQDRVVFKYWDGYGAKEFLTLEGATATQLLSTCQRIDNRLFFMMSVVLNGTLREGTWSIGGSPSGGWSLIHERTPNNDTALSSGVLNGFVKVGDYLFQSYQTNGAFALSKTNDQASYTATSIWETKINPSIPEADGTQLIKIYSIGGNYDALPASGQVVVKHRVQGGTYATVFTETADGVTYTEPVGQYADGTHFNDKTKEHEFRVESTGGAVVVGLVLKYELLPSNA